MARSKLGDRKSRKDRFHQNARKRGFNSRAVFKLEEIDSKAKLIEKGHRVLDLGCAPGSWLQYAASRTGASGALVGIDRFEVDLGLPNGRTLVGNVYKVEIEDLLGDLDNFDVVLSDMAPDTTGVRSVDQTRSEQLFERALDIADATLAHDGAFLGKLFQGPEFQTLIKRCRRDFAKVKIIKPEGSRKESIEQYICATGYRGQPTQEPS
jgi:23S rRNA (uridine2552-2'-O)-methyltransferase